MIRSDDPLAALLKPERLIDVVDVGANPFDGGAPPYKIMLDKKLCRVVGFEPFPSALAKLNEIKGPNEIYLPHAVGDGTRQTFHLCYATGMSSLLEPDPASLDLFPEFAAWGRVVNREEAQTVRLDDVGEVQQIDFLKLDIQGSELSVLQNAHSKLRDAVAVQTEVCFVPLYKGQPSFGAIDLELGALGFILHTLTGVVQKAVAPMRSADPHDHFNQIMSADAVYIRDFRNMDAMSPEQMKALAIICHHAYGSFDVAARCVLEIQRRGIIADDAMNQYASIIGRQKR